MMKWLERWIGRMVRRSPPPLTFTAGAARACFDELHALATHRLLDKYGPSVLAIAHLGLAEAAFGACIDRGIMTADQVTAEYEKLANKYRVRRRS
jgi:hypothetical protein